MNPPYEYRSIPWRESAFEQSGRVLVGIEGKREPRLAVYNYEGSRLPAYHICAVLKVAFTEKWVDRLEKLHQNRQNNWKAETFISPHGDKEYRLYTTGQSESVCSSIITISNNQIHTFSILAEDAAPLLKKIIEDYPPVFLSSSRNYGSNQCFPALYYLEDQNIKFFQPPEPIKEQIKRAQRIMVDKDIFLSGSFPAGETSGISETIEAFKCLEVLQA